MLAWLPGASEYFSKEEQTSNAMIEWAQKETAANVGTTVSAVLEREAHFADMLCMKWKQLFKYN